MNIKDIASLANYVDILNIPIEWITYYEPALKAFNKDWINIDFNELFNFYQFDDEFKQRFMSEINLLKRDDNLNFLVYLWYFIMFFTDQDYKIWQWKTELSYFKSHGSFMMPVIAFLMGYKEHKKVMKEKNYDEKQINIHKYNIRLATMSDRLRLGIDGVRFSQMIWASMFMKGHIIQIGSLQYELKKQYLNNKDVIFIHIPRGTSLDEKSVNNSLTIAPKYVNKYLTKNNLKYVTSSWLLSENLKTILNEESNIMKFQKKFNIIDRNENIKDFLNFVFNEPMFYGDYNQLPEKTRLQKGLKNKLINGEKLYICLGILK